jgi:hypothetical protein
MSYDDLVCAACSGRVLDGDCPVCRASRQTLRRPQLPADLVLAVAAVMALLLILATHLRG